MNLGAGGADGLVALPWTDLDDHEVVLEDLLGSARHERNGGQIMRDGLYVALDGHGSHLFSLTTPT